MEAIAADRQAIAINPKFAMAYSNLGRTMSAQGKFDEAIAVHRQALAIDPTSVEGHIDLGIILNIQGKPEEALAAYREAERLQPKSARPLHLQRELFQTQGRLDDVIAVCRRLVASYPGQNFFLYPISASLRRQGKLEEAIAEGRRLVALEPKFPFGHWCLGLALRDQDKLQEAATELREAAALFPGLHRLHADIESVDRMIAVHGKLPAFLKGEFKPQTPDERLGLAGLCKIKKRYAAAAVLYADAFMAEPKLVEDWRAGHLCEAADCAAAAGTGLGEDADKLAENERPAWRKQALDWMRAEQAMRVRYLETGDTDDRIMVQQKLDDWRSDSDLAGVREPEALAKLPGEEQEAWRALWAEVTALQNKAQAARH